MQRDEAEPDIIHLSGGPHDGESFTWRGGDTVKMTMSAQPGLLTKGWLPVQVPTRDILYRRSLVTENVFVFQP